MDLKEIRLEALKMSYNWITNVCSSKYWHILTRAEQKEIVKEIFNLAKDNIYFIENGDNMICEAEEDY